MLFSYLNPFLAAGRTRSAHERAGCHGLLMTDLPVGADPARSRFAASPLAFIRLVAPTTPVDRMRQIASTAADSST